MNSGNPIEWHITRTCRQRESIENSGLQYDFLAFVGQDPDFAKALYWINAIFVAVYVFEIVSKLIAYSFVFFEDLWYVLRHQR